MGCSSSRGMLFSICIVIAHSCRHTDASQMQAPVVDIQTKRHESDPVKTARIVVKNVVKTK